MKQANVLALPQTALPQVLEHMATLADPLRCRVLLLLERHELTVTELCAVLQLPQSTVSRHLKTLADGGWVTSRRDGTSRFYGLTQPLEVSAARLWPLIREQVSTSPAAEHDDRRAKGVLEQRRSTSEAFFSKASGQWALMPSATARMIFRLIVSRSSRDMPGLRGTPAVTTTTSEPAQSAQLEVPTIEAS